MVVIDLNNSGSSSKTVFDIAAAEQKRDGQEYEEANKIPYMICECHDVKIRCQSLMEAEQRARIHNEESKNHKAVWRFE
jgi:hypothetical protein